MDTTPTAPICPNCGKPLVAGAPGGLCPECLIKAGFETKAGQEPAGGSPAFVPAPVEEITKLFPQLEIISLLGHGGMGVVYKARQPRLNRFVALKILSPEKKNDPQFAERFEREARALASLTHPNIVTVYDFGEVQGNYYLLMEFVDGVTLRQFFQARRLTPAEALTVVPKICDALQYAHEHGIVHRDIKPENILIDKDGRVKIADFGIAKILDQPAQDIPLTGVKDVVGTVHYMAPEQIEHPQEVDCRADIYSLGVVFYEMLTGELPIGKFLPPSEKAQTDVRLDEVVMHALEKEPERRYQTANQMKTAVETIASTTPPPAPHPVPEEPVPVAAATGSPEDYTLDIGSCLGRGWSLVIGNFWPAVGVTMLNLLLQWASFVVIIKPLLSGPLMGGLCLYYLKKIRGEPATLGTTFSGFNKAFLPLFLGSLMVLVLTFVGFLCLVLPGIYLGVAWIFTLPLVIDKQLGFWDAMGLSRKTISKHWWKFFGFIIILGLIKMAGTMVFAVGYLIAAPVAMAALMYAYEDIFGAARPAAAPASATVYAEPHPLRGWAWFLAGLVVLLGIALGVVATFKHATHSATSLSTSIAKQTLTQSSSPTTAATGPGDTTADDNLLNADQRLALQFFDRKFHNLLNVDNVDGQEQALIQALSGPRSDELSRAISSLAAMRSTKAVPALRKLALDPGKKILKVEVNNRPRWMAVRALGIIGDKTSVPKMIHLIYHNNSYVRWMAQISLVRLTGRNFGGDWKAWGIWWNSQNGRPPFDPTPVQWWPGQEDPDKGAAILADADRKFIENIQVENSKAGSPTIDDAFWLHLDRRNYQHYRDGLRKAPHMLVVRLTHFDINKQSATGIGMHYSWIDGKMANLCVGFSDLVSYGYSKGGGVDEQMLTRTEFPPGRGQGRFTNRFDLIDTVKDQPVEKLQAEIKQQLREQFGLSWHREMRDTEALVIQVADPHLLASKITSDFANSRSIPEAASAWENYFGKPVLDETGLTNRYDKKLDSIPAAYIPNRTKDLDANNAFLEQYGLRLVPTNKPMEWLALDPTAQTTQATEAAAQPAEAKPILDAPDFSVTGTGFAIETLANGQSAYLNRDYAWEDVPEKFRGWRYTKIRGGSHPQIHVHAKRDIKLQLLAAVDLAGWERTGTEIHYNDKKNTRMVLFQKNVAAGADIDIPQGDWSGTLALLPASSFAQILDTGVPNKTITSTHPKIMNYKLVNLQNNKVIPNPTDADIRATVHSLHDDFGPVLALETTGEEQPLQMDEIEKGSFGFNCKDGDTGYFVKKGHECSAEVAIKIIISYRDGTADWKTMTEWDKLKL